MNDDAKPSAPLQPSNGKETPAEKDVPQAGLPGSVFLIMLIGFLALLGVSGAFLWRAYQMSSSPRISTLSSDTSPLSPQTGEPSAVTRSAAAPPVIDSLPVNPEQVLHEAELNKGARYLQGTLTIAETPYEIKGWYRRLLPDRSTIEVVFFDHALTREEESMLDALPPFKDAGLSGALLYLTFEFRPFGTDCSIISLVRYSVVVPPTLLGGTAELRAQGDTTQSVLTDIRKISCIRKKGEIFELSIEGAPKPGITLRVAARDELR